MLLYLFKALSKSHSDKIGLIQVNSSIANLEAVLKIIINTFRHKSPAREVVMEKEMASHSSVLAWRAPWTEEPDRLQSMGSQEPDTT